MRRIRITYANVVSTLALCLAIGGVSYAAVKLPKNSVTSQTIKNAQVKNADLAKNAVTSAKIKNGTVADADLAGGIGGAKLADGSVAGSKLADGIAGGKLADGSVAASKLAAGTTTPADGSITSAKITDGTVGFNDLSGDLQSRAVAAYASIDGFGPTIQSPYNKNVISVTRNGGAGRYCLNVDWAAAGRNPAQQATPVIVTARSIDQHAAGDVYNPSCANNGVSVSLQTSATSTVNASYADGWVHVLIP
jgi:hypothetical protein